MQIGLFFSGYGAERALAEPCTEMATTHLCDDSAAGSLVRVDDGSVVTLNHREGLKSVMTYLVLLNKEN
jgi:hypothetical protein